MNLLPKLLRTTIDDPVQSDEVVQAEKPDNRPAFRSVTQRDSPFHQHDFRSRIDFLKSPNLPRILISAHAYRRMCLIVELAPQEVGWLGTVERLRNGNFYIDEIFVPDQEVTGSETDPTDEGQFKIMNELAEQGEEGMQKIERLRFWGHSHVHMMTSPSSTDENTPLNYQRLGLPWFIRGIFNKMGRAEFTVYLFEDGYRFLDVPWIAVDAQSGKPLSVETNLDKQLIPDRTERKSVESELKAKLKQRQFSRFFGGINRFAGEPNFADASKGQGYLADQEERKE